MPEKCYLPLQELYVPSVCRYEYTLDEAVHADKFVDFVGDVQRAAEGLASSLYYALTLQKAKIEDGEAKVEAEEKEYDDSLWAFVPMQDLNTKEDWNHQRSPTIFFRPTLDLMLRKSTTPTEQTHVIAFSLVVICHELAHLMPRFIYGKDFLTPGRTKSRVGSRATEGKGEGVEAMITGGQVSASTTKLVCFDSFFTAISPQLSYHTDETSHSFAIRPLYPHGFRICAVDGSRLTLVLDDQIERFLSSFFVYRMAILSKAGEGISVSGKAYRECFGPVDFPPKARPQDLPAFIVPAAKPCSPPRTPSISARPSPSRAPQPLQPPAATSMLDSPFFLTSGPVQVIPRARTNGSDKNRSFPGHLLGKPDITANDVTKGINEECDGQ
ncbi:hypothetical protein BT96DRAFT_992815 [Gymnopus androsaceus JB14]|uniref:Uncharacterized protein n=1 Tax=Gymnopus androsaceus JB14 TaxID=1447944 RepID=A0A6A4HRH7_9AGAR|nr:hypothetical protein BT96DRAFT_992815 [Gymnopus androsaceus JB14]